MSVLRYGVSLLVNLAVTAIGAILAYMGISSLVTTILLYSFLETELPGSQTTMNEALGEATRQGGGVAFDFFADLTPWLITFGTLFGGLALLFFGGRGVWRRLRAGLPDEDEGDPRTAEGRIGHILIYGAGAAIGLLRIVIGLLDVADYAVLYTSGGRTWGVVEREQDTVRTKEKETFSGMFIDVRYQTADGQEMIAQTPISYELARIVEVGDRIEVMYSLSDPQRYRLPAKFDLLGVVIDFAIMGFLAVFGIRGLRRNLDLGDLDSRERWSDA